MEDGPFLAHAEYPLLNRKPGARDLERNAAHRVVVLAPGGARNAMRDSPVRRWPVASYKALTEELLARDCRIVLVGGPEDVELSAQFSGMQVTDLVGKTSLRELAEVIADASLVITHDSLALHMSVWLKRKVLALFGPTSPLQFCPPVLTEVVRSGQRMREPERPIHVLWGGEDLACRPCYDGREFHSCPLNKCMRDIRVREVVDMVDEILKGATCSSFPDAQ
jgi:heptosyltransferase-2